MDIKEILSKVDHTVLGVDATKEDIISLCDDAKKYKVASVCIAPSFVKFAADYLNGEIPVCTVIGFPLGYQTTKIKIEEAVRVL